MRARRAGERFCRNDLRSPLNLLSDTELGAICARSGKVVVIRISESEREGSYPGNAAPRKRRPLSTSNVSRNVAISECLSEDQLLFASLLNHLGSVTLMGGVNSPVVIEFGVAFYRHHLQVALIDPDYSAGYAPFRR